MKVMDKLARELKGKNVKIVYRDGEIIRSIRGTIIDSSENFLKIHTLRNEFYFNFSDVLKIRVIKGD